MTSGKARKAAIRDRMASTGEPYSVAARAVQAQQTAAAGTLTIDPQLTAPYPDERDVRVEELGWRALPPDATAAQRARAEAVWRPVTVNRPCRCSGPCNHGEPCGEEYTDGTCDGRTIHVDRHPGSLLTPVEWFDTYVCDTCDDEYGMPVVLPDLPWAERTPGSDGLSIFPGVRHPNIREDVEDDEGDDYPDYGCPECNGDVGCVCDEDGGCPECGAGGRGDPYGECLCEY